MGRKVVRKKLKKLDKNVPRFKKCIKGKKINKDSVIRKYDELLVSNIINNEYKKKDNKLRSIQYFIGFFVIFLLILLLFILCIPKISIDNNYEEIRYNSDYNVLGYKAYNYFKDYTDKVIVNDKVMNNKVGTYYIKYILKYGFITIEKKKEVVVIDDLEPNITLVGSNEVVVCPNSKYKEDGYSAFDQYDGDISDKVEINASNNMLEYLVSDSSGNSNNVIRNISYADNEKPRIELVGSDEVTIYKGNNYKELGYKAYDNCDGEINDKVVISNNIDINKVGVYEVVYSAEDSSSNSISVIRKVRVIERKVTSVNNKGIIYLTFDDGPSSLTGDILDVLKEEGVIATFFVTGNVDSYKSILKREYNEGHAIGLHTYSHNYKYLYSNKNNFFSDIDKLNDSIYNIIGKKSNIIRFPGGSSNTISKNYSNGIMSYLTEEVINRGYKYFDWNVDSNDAGSDISNSDRIYSNVINNLNYNGVNVILMHDSNGHKETVLALRNIIKYGKNNGYSFMKIDSNTSMVRHNVNN